MGDLSNNGLCYVDNLKRVYKQIWFKIYNYVRIHFLHNRRLYARPKRK